MSTTACPGEVEVDGTMAVNANMTSLADLKDHTLEVRRLSISSSILVDGLYTGFGPTADFSFFFCLHPFVCNCTVMLLDTQTAWILLA